MAQQPDGRSIVSDDQADRDRQRRALGRLLMGAGELMTDDDKRARFEAKILDLREQIGNDPRKMIDLARAIADAMRRGYEAD